MLAPSDGGNDDFTLLRSADLRRQDWSRRRLAVLSACAAAAGETRGAHNPDSLVRALGRAGVSRVVASFWTVDSFPTSDLMKEFYASLANGEGTAQALRRAQQQIRNRNPAWNHPYYWAGFVLQGEPR